MKTEIKTDMLTVPELALIVNCSERTIQRNAKKGLYVYKETINDKNKKVFMFPVASLPADIRHKYLINNREDIAGDDIKTFSEKEREELDFWIGIIKDWQITRENSELSKNEVDEAYVSMMKLKNPDVKCSRRILYRKLKYYRDGQYKKMIDNRGKSNKGRTKVTNEMRDIFASYFLNESRYPITKCYEYMKLSIASDYPQQYEMIPSLRTMQRDMLKYLNYNERVYGRYGRKAYDDLCAMHIRRVYDEMNSNDYWIGDTHTLDVMSRDKDGKVHRLYLNAWMDARSGVMVGWYITANPSSQATVYALRDAILRRDAIPYNVYVDNGPEYLTHDVGGRGHRTKKKHRNEFNPPPIFKRLGINMTNAIVKNAKAKTIERRFLDFKNQISRLFETYTGGSVAEKPEILKTRLKNGEVIVDETLKENIDDIIEYYFNYSEYGGSVSADKGKRKIDVYNEYQTSVRRASKDELELMLLRSSRLKKVGRRGVSLNINGELFDYQNEQLHNLRGESVYFRYDPDDLSYVRIYDKDDRYLFDAPCADSTVLEYGASREDIKNAMKEIRGYSKKDIKKVEEIRAIGTRRAVDAILAQAHKNKENPANKANVKVVNIIRAEEKALVDTDYDIDMDTMLKNASRKLG